LAGVRSLADALAASPSEDTRLRLRAVLRRVVSAVRCLFASGRGSGDRLAMLQVEFRGSASRRIVLVALRPSRNNGKSQRRPALFVARTVKHPDDRLPFDQFDLREEHLTPPSYDGDAAVAGWREAESWLASYPQDALDQLLRDEGRTVLADSPTAPSGDGAQPKRGAKGSAPTSSRPKKSARRAREREPGTRRPPA
jgi:hypothetical protein